LHGVNKFYAIQGNKLFCPAPLTFFSERSEELFCPAPLTFFASEASKLEATGTGLDTRSLDIPRDIRSMLSILE